MSKAKTLEDLKAYLKRTKQFIMTVCTKHNIGYNPLKEHCSKCLEERRKEKKYDA